MQISETAPQGHQLIHTSTYPYPYSVVGFFGLAGTIISIPGIVGLADDKDNSLHIALIVIGGSLIGLSAYFLRENMKSDIPVSLNEPIVAGITENNIVVDIPVNNNITPSEVVESSQTFNQNERQQNRFFRDVDTATMATDNANQNIQKL